MFFNHIDRAYSDTAVEKKGDRWFIKFGFCGFNSFANNRDGYRSKESAEKEVLYYQTKLSKVIGLEA